MKKLMLLASCVLMQAVFAADLSGNITFAADYRTGSAVPQIAKGGKSYRTLLNGKLTFADGGLLVGNDKCSLRYPVAGNLNPGSGAVEMLVRNVDWELGDNLMHTFFCASGKSGTFYIYKFKKDGLGGCFALISDSSRKSYFPRQMVKRLSGNAARHLVVNYTPESYAFYLDGKLVSERECEIEFKADGSFFVVGAPGDRSGRPGDTWIGFIRMYNRPLAGSEVAELAQQANAK